MNLLLVRSSTNFKFILVHANLRSSTIMSLHSALLLGESYSKKTLSDLLNEPSLAPVREGIYTCKNNKSIMLFVDLVKNGKEERFHFNDYFQEDYFHWDSQPRQDINTPTIKKLISGLLEVNLFVRIDQKVKSNTQPFKYCGRLEYTDYYQNTSKPVHIVFSSIDYDENNGQLKDIYLWQPETIGKSTTNNNYGVKPGSKQKNFKKPNYTERKGLINSRVGQGYYRQEILNKWDNRCAVTGLGIKEVLIASHIVPWKSADDQERLDFNNGILLSPNLDALFDKHLISFDDNGKILIHSRLDVQHQECLGIKKEMKLRSVNTEMRKYLEIHRVKFYESN
jgi:hypothetical protein